MKYNLDENLLKMLESKATELVDSIEKELDKVIANIKSTEELKMKKKLKMIKVSDMDFEINTGTTMYINIDVFKFIKDEQLPCIEIQIETNGEYEFLEEIEETDELSIVDNNDLRKFALNWIFNNVEIAN